MKGKSVFLLVVLALLAFLAVVAIWTQIVPKYQANGEVRIEPIKPYLVYRTEDGGAILFYEGFVNTQVSVMKSPKVLQRVLDQQEVQQTQWYKNPPKSLNKRLLGGPVDPPLERLREALSALPRPNTEIVDVSFMDAVAKDSAVTVNAVLDQYIKYIGEASDKKSGELYRKLVEQFNLLRSEIEVRQHTLVDLRKKLGTTKPQELIAAKRMRLDQKQARLKDLQNRIELMEKALDQVNLVDSNEAAVASTERVGLPDYSTDPEWQKLNESVTALRHQIITSALISDDPNLRTLGENLVNAEKSLQLREDLLEKQWRDRTENKAGSPLMASTPGAHMPGAIPGENVHHSLEGVTSLEDRLALAKEEERQLSAEIEKERQEFHELFETAQLYEDETARLREKREVFDAVRQRKEQKDMERNVPDSMSISILSRAAVPTEPYKDRRIQYTAIILALYLTVGSCIAILGRKRETSK